MVRVFFFSAWRLSSTWYPSGWKIRMEYRGGEAVPLEQILVVLLSSLAFWKTQGLIPHRYFSPVMPLHSPLVTIFVFQVDDINADKNVSSAQIIGECE